MIFRLKTVSGLSFRNTLFNVIDVSKSTSWRTWESLPLCFLLSAQCSMPIHSPLLIIKITNL